MPNVAPVPYKTPMLDSNGLLTVPWISWLRQLMVRIGGNDAELLNNPMISIGDLIYGGRSGSPLRLAGDISNARKFLRELSQGGAATPPVWDTLVAADIPALAYVASVAMTVPSILSVVGSPITSSGTLALSLSSQSANTVFAGPSSGSASTPSFRALVNADISTSIVTKTANYTAATSDNVILCNTNAFTVTLPAANALAGQLLRIKKIGSDANSITIATAGSDKIQGATSITLTSQYDEIILMSDGASVWYIYDFIKNPTIQTFTSSSGTYTTPNGVRRLRVRMVGGGGGGGPSGSTTGTAGQSGTNSLFGTSLLVANGGAGGIAAGGSPALGGTSSISSPAVGIAISGAQGGGAIVVAGSLNFFPPGQNGGSSPFGGAGGGGSNGGTSVTAGGAAATNSGSGGGGASGPNSSSPSYGGGGGASGGYVDAIITSPNASYTYTVGAAGAAGVTGTSGANGGNGGSGFIIVEEYYQ